MSTRAKVIALLVCSALAFCWGAASGETHTKTKIIHKTEVKTKTVIKRDPYVPKSCTRILELNTTINEAAGTYEQHIGALIRMTSRIRLAAAEHSSTQANTLTEELDTLSSKTIKASSDLAKARIELRDANIACLKEIDENE